MFEAPIFSILFIIRNVIELVAVPRNPDQRRPSPGRGLYSLIVMGAAFLASAVAVAHTLYWLGPFSQRLFVLGLLLLGLGYAGRVYCVRKLAGAYSQSFETDPRGHLETGGIYGWVRHPIYAFFLLEAIALLAVCPNWVSFLAIFPIAATVVYRIRKEEAKLLDRFGHLYRDYRANTGALVPFLR